MKTPVISALLILIVAMTAVANDSNEGQRLSLKEAVTRALAENPHLRLVRLEIRAAQARVSRGRSGYFPQINAGGIAKQGLSGSGGAFGLQGLASSPLPRDLAVSGNVYQDLWDFGRAKHETKARRFELGYYQGRERAESSRLILEVKKAYYDVLKAQELAAAAAHLLDERRLALRKAEVFDRAELRSKVEVGLARVELSRAELRHVQAVNEQARSQATLHNIMGAGGPVEEYILDKPTLDLIELRPLVELVAAGLEGRPDLRAAKVRIQASEEWLDRARRERYPRLMGAFSGGWTRFANLTVGKLLFGGFGLKLPIFTGGRLKADIEEAAQGLSKARVELTELQQRIRLEINHAYHDLANAVKAVKSQQEIIRQTEQASRLARVRYKLGLSDRVELATAESAYAVAQSDLTWALYDYKIRESELQYAIGQRNH